MNTFIQAGMYGCLVPILIAVLFPVLLPFYIIIFGIIFFIRLFRKIWFYFILEPAGIADDIMKLIDTETKYDKKPDRTADFMTMYGGGMIEEYRKENIYRVLDENAIDTGRSFDTLDKAKEYIGTYIPVPSYKSNRRR